MPNPVLAAASLCLALSACATQPPPPEPVVETAPRLLLLGEVHDNAVGHALRLRHLQSYVDGTARVAIAMEQFDRERQADLDAALARCEDAACVIDAVAPGKSGWNWDHYAPVVQLALDHDLPLLAANLSRAEASAVVKDGFGAALSPELHAKYALDALPEALLEAQVAEVREGHCNMLPDALFEPMARAQIARDVVMADTVLAALGGETAADVVFLLAGNGHVNRDVGVPHWLIASGSGEQLVATGYLEEGNEDERRHFDNAYLVPPTEREDPCAAFQPPKKAAKAG